jgi:hypothetical protein
MQAINSIYALTPRPSWDRCIEIIKDQMMRDETRKLEYASVMGSSKRQSIGMVATKLQYKNNDVKGKTAFRPCRHCGGEHCDNKCPSLTKALSTASKPAIQKCQVCDGSHKVTTCPVVKTAKESITGKKVAKLSRTDVTDSEDIIGLTKMFAKLSKSYGPKSMEAITQFAKDNAGMSAPSKAQAHQAKTKPALSIGFMCKTKDVSHSILLDSGSQEHIIKDKELMDYIKPCKKDIYLSGITESKHHVVSKGCGRAMGLDVYYVPDATSNLISYSKLREADYIITTSQSGDVFEIRHEDHDQVMMRAVVQDGLTVINYCYLPRIMSWIRQNAMAYSNVVSDAEKVVVYKSKAEKRKEKVVKLHDQLGNPSFIAMYNMLSQGNILNTAVTAGDVANHREIIENSLGRLLATSTNKVNSESSSSVASRIGERIKLRKYPRRQE